MILAVAGIFGLGQFIEGNLISPRLVGSRIHLHPVWMIFAVLAGTTLFGLLGTLLAVPFAAVLGVLIRFGLEQYQKSALFDAPEQIDALADADLVPANAGPPPSAQDQQPGDRKKTGTLG
jgi:predicted PurR-regulated permease PerM